MRKNNLIYQEILKSKANNVKLLAILLDPDKIVWATLDALIDKINQSPATHIFVGGSLVTSARIDELIIRLKQKISLPIVLFPGNPSQISQEADGILFLSLLSGRNPDYLIEHQVKAAPLLKKTKLEIISTGYVLIESGSVTAVERVSQTKPLPRDDNDLTVATALAGEMLGNRLIYLEAGSGAQNEVPQEMVQLVADNLEVPLIVGGGISSLSAIKRMYDSGADLVVIGTAFERNSLFFEQLPEFENHKIL
ncbi:geranylgeranylglyceryl/heptaprenylglyceryl phosphate synthase [Flavobacterium algicola]|uniref:geranylgeranylglyceryl/heptaprenylglyceryl phosphate synthase n=1 Tax=Flavobacterium algicola TaxID=556529 RepID=UPI001EFC5A7E|nr:geranylgeranylglyceryl/heptaprenylglyceryl phosphate synthase [Flavobacterium algicola]MCG9791595.1 geranylgeranylglyceryl/heptaprenylglyceryl phosphate synthase [Flavobacterium algicola]